MHRGEELVCVYVTCQRSAVGNWNHLPSLYGCVLSLKCL